MKKHKILTRTISGAIFVALLVGSIFVSKWTFLALIMFVSSVSIYEFHHITRYTNRIEVPYGVAIVANCMLQLIAFLHFFPSIFQNKLDTDPIDLMPIYIFFVILVFIAELFRHCERPLHNWAYFVLGQVYVSCTFASLYGIISYGGEGVYNKWLMLAIFIIIWTNDTFAYLIGSAVKNKHHLFRRISPHKSWEGFFGGAVFALGAGVAFAIFKSDILSPVEWMVFAVIVVVFGTLGDLMESLIKRSVGAKDSGKIMPGHGGLLDRFDSMMLAAPVIYLFLTLIG